MKGQALAIALVVMCGVGTYIMFLTTLGSLRATQDSYYREYRFAEVFVSLKRAPEVAAPAHTGHPRRRSGGDAGGRRRCAWTCRPSPSR